MDRVGHYVLEERIGSGGMGEVYRARDAALGRSAAVKLMLPGGDGTLRERLLREAEHTARLQHPFIATFFDGGLDGDRAWLAVEYVPGETLRSRLARGPLTVRDTIALGTALLEALTHAHAAGVLHRDLKPENVMLRSDGHLKLLDFGLARALVTPGGETMLQLTTVGVAVGTIGYMPPEQLRGDVVDARTDLFAVGAVLYECLTARAAFPGRNPVERITAVLSDERPALPAGVPDGLGALIRRALARSPEDRPPTAAAFLRALREVDEFGDGPVMNAEPPSLAIADFENLSGNGADSWIGSGVAESLGADLSRIAGLRVIARERWLQARAGESGPRDALGAAQALGVRWLLAGGFQRLGPGLRLTARLTDVAGGQVAWAEKLDGPVDQIFSMQDRLTASVASALNLHQPTPPSVRPQLTAYECYTRGRRLFDRLDKGSIEQAEALYLQAIDTDPACAPAYAGLAGMYAMRYTFTTDPSVLHAAIEHATRALEIDPAGADARVWRGYAWWRLGRHEEALAEEQRVLDLDARLYKAPYFAGAILLDQGHPGEALPFVQRAVETDPAIPYSWLVLGVVHLRLDRLAEAQYCFERAARLERDGDKPIVGARAALAEAARRQGALAAARATALEALEGIEGADHMYRDTHRGAALIVLGRCARDQGDEEAAAAAFGQACGHLRGRPRALGGGHLLVQALAGLAVAKHRHDILEEAAGLFRERTTHHFGWAFLASEIESAVQLALAAARLGPESTDILGMPVLSQATPREQAAIRDAGAGAATGRDGPPAPPVQ